MNGKVERFVVAVDPYSFAPGTHGHQVRERILALQALAGPLLKGRAMFGVGFDDLSILCADESDAIGLATALDAVLPLASKEWLKNEEGDGPIFHNANVELALLEDYDPLAYAAAVAN